MRPIWTGSIGFGLVSIPVKMYSATQGSELDLDMLDEKDHSNIRFQRVNENTGKVVPWEHIVKGYKYDGEYVVLTKKDFEMASAKKSKVIEISDFVKVEDIDPIYYETPYYLAPDKNGERAYALLREALAKTGKVGVATFVMRSKETLAVLRSSDDVILLNRLRFYEEIRKTGELDLPKKAGVKANELQMAVSLINQLSGKFRIEEYKDTYTEELMKLIKAKAKGKPIKAPKLKVVHSKSKDLMDQLKASLGTTRKKAS